MSKVVCKLLPVTHNPPDLVESIRGVGDKLPQEDFFVGVEGVDDQAHELSDLGLESEGLGIIRHSI